MPLTSLLFRDSQELQDCLIRDSSHVKQGAQGDHVRLIHKCLLLLEPTPLRVIEIEGMSYGASTANAVLAYKRKRSIINTSYQKTADDVVGKMTIARMDKDIKDIEGGRSNLSRCEPGRGGHIRPFLANSFDSNGRNVALTGDPPVDPSVKHTLLSIHLQHVDSTEFLTSGVFVNNLLARARALLRPHGMVLDEPTLFPSGPVPWPEGILKTQFPVDRFAIRKSAALVQPGADNVLRVIFCVFDPIDTIKGITEGGLDAIEKIQKFSLINLALDHRNPDGGTLLHEMVHASFKGASPGHDGDQTSVYSEGESRTRLRKEHGTQLAGAFFARKLR